MATDARVRYTKMVIVQSFIKLLKDKPINRITVKEICELSEINRATFYKHYLDVYDLLDKIEEQYLDELMEVLKSRKNNTPKDVLTLIMASFKAEEEIYTAVFSENGDPSFPAKVLEKCNYVEIDQSHMSKNLTKEQRIWVYQFIANGCNGILNKWISDGMKEPISEVAEFVEVLVNSSLSNL